MSTGPYVASRVERGIPTIDVMDPTPAQARTALKPVLDRAGLGTRSAADLTGAVSEVVTNARGYGEPPVRMRAWVDGGEVTVAVSDRGPGPSDADLGRAPLVRELGQGGLGLWLATQMCDELVMGVDHDGFTVRLVAR